MFTVHREEHRTGYTCIANELIHDKRMSLNARALMILVLSLPKDWDFTVRGLAKMCGMSEKTVFRYFEELKRLGYLRCAKEKGGDGRYLERNYIFYESSVSPQDIIPADTAPPAENDRQYSNNININNKSDKEKKNPAEKAEEYQRILELFCSICVSLPPVTELTVQRYRLMEQAERQTEDFAELFRRIESSDFLTGRNGKWNGCTFDWLLRPETLIKLAEGRYDNRKPLKKEEKRNYQKPVTARKDDTDEGFLF